jgi:hypothetical protein
MASARMVARDRSAWFRINSVNGQIDYLYMAMDVWSRRIIGVEMHQCEAGELAKNFFDRICRDEGINKEDAAVLHSDNGAPMRSSTLAAKMSQLGVSFSFSRKPTRRRDRRILGADRGGLVIGHNSRLYASTTPGPEIICFFKVRNPGPRPGAVRTKLRSILPPLIRTSCFTYPQSQQVILQL